MDQVVTRFAPSPTGHLHLGSARTALFSYLLSRHYNGKFLLRIEDTDQQRSKQIYIDSILSSMQWLGLDWDGEPVYQSRRFSHYDQAIQQLLKEGHAYRCLCTPARLDQLREQQLAQGKKPKYDGHCRDKNIGADAKNFVVRFKTPLPGKTQFHDSLRGTIEMDNEELDDLIIARADGTPTYNLCVVIDDIAMGITHILRGDDHLTNSLKQINIYQALGASLPEFTHLAMITNQNNQRLSKRDNAQDIHDYQKQGILPEALCSYIARLGWSHGDKELFDRDELVALFDTNKLQASPARFDERKLLWVNQQFIQAMSVTELATHIKVVLKDKQIASPSKPSDLPLDDIIKLHQPQATSLVELADDIMFYYIAPSIYPDNKHISDKTISYLQLLQQQLDDCSDWSAEAIKQILEDIINTQHIKFPQLAMPLRIALCGRSSSPAIHDVAALLGRQRTLSRLTAFIDFLHQSSTV